MLTVSRSFRLSGRPSSSFVSSYMKPTTHVPGGVARVFSFSAAWIFAMLPRFVFTFFSSSTPTPDGWEWASMKPGSTHIPPTSSTSVRSAAARLRTSSSDPTATNRPRAMANAVADGVASSCVSTRPFTTMRSGAVSSGAPASVGAHPAPRPAAAAAPRPRNSFRLTCLTRHLREAGAAQSGGRPGAPASSWARPPPGASTGRRVRHEVPGQKTGPTARRASSSSASASGSGRPARLTTIVHRKPAAKPGIIS